MPLNFWLFFLACVVFLNPATSRNDENHSSDDEELFVPTRNWQVVKKGQKIPKGLHVRMNLETGVTEAKILDENENKKTSAVVEVPDAQNSNHESAGNLKYSEAKLKDALKNIKSDDVPEDKRAKKAKSKFRSYEELKKDLSDLNLTPKTDMEMLKELLTQYHEIEKFSKNEDAQKLTILEDLEFLVHQIDNANEFTKLNGFRRVIYQNLNSTNVEIKKEALKLLGSSVQNNAKVQIHALETGSVGVLLRVLVLDSDFGVKNRAIFALGSLLRRFPLAQLQFVDNAGLTVFTELLEKVNNIKIHLKIVTLVNDLVLEHTDALEDFKSGNNSEKILQYNQISLKNKLQEHNWCKKLIKLLINTINADSNDHDAIEKCLIAIRSIIDTCDADSILSMKDVVMQLRSLYKSLAANDLEVDSNYYIHVFDICNQIINYFNYKYKLEL